jgi:hypothetical protein
MYVLCNAKIEQLSALLVRRLADGKLKDLLDF